MHRAVSTTLFLEGKVFKEQLLLFDLGSRYNMFVFYLKLIIEHSHSHSLQPYRRCMPRVIKNDLQGLVISDNYEWLAIQGDVKLSTREISGQCLQLDVGISPLGV